MRRVFLLPATLLLVGALLALPSGQAGAQQTVTIPVGDNWFCDPSFQDGVCESTIDVDDTVIGDFSGAVNSHTTTECGASCDSPTGTPLWDSGVVMGGGAPFQFTFDQPGTYLYYCQIHPLEMRGRIIVQDAQQPTDTPTDGAPTDGGTTGATATPTDGGTQLPQTGTGAETGSSGGWWMLAMLAGAGVALAGLGAVTYRRVRVER